MVSAIYFTYQCDTIRSFVPQEYRGVFDAAVKFYEAYDHEFTPKEEYYIGRTVAASILKGKKPYGFGKSAFEKYIQSIGYTLSMSSNRPETFQGYRFIILKSKSVNAYAVPSGYIFITEGLLRLAKNEDELAGVLAHEVCHVVLKHPVKSIESARKNAAVGGLLKEGASVASGGKVPESMMKAFDGVIKDVIKSVEKGYGKEQEKEADLNAVDLLVKAGYNPRGLSAMLRKLKVGGGVHGNPQDRANDVDSKIATYNNKIPQTLRVRTARFKKAYRSSKSFRFLVLNQ